MEASAQVVHQLTLRVFRHRLWLNVETLAMPSTDEGKQVVGLLKKVARLPDELCDGTISQEADMIWSSSAKND